MTDTQKVIGSLMMECGRAVTRLSDEQLEKLLEGKAHLRLSLREPKPRKAALKKRVKAAPHEPIPPNHFPLLLPRLMSAPSRDECHRLVVDAFAQKSDLYAFAKFLHLAVQKKDSKDRIRDRIVEMTAGARLDGEVIRGGY